MLLHTERRIPLKTISRLLPLVIGIVLLFTACGYRNPNVYNGPEKSIFIKTWKNRTNKLGIDIDIYQSMVKWFQKADSITITSSKKSADYILAGEIVSIDLPSHAYGSQNTAKEVKLKLKVRYILKNLSTGKVLIEKPTELYTEEYFIGDGEAITSENEDKALDEIIDQLSQNIYRKAIREISRF